MKMHGLINKGWDGRAALLLVVLAGASCGGGSPTAIAVRLAAANRDLAGRIDAQLNGFRSEEKGLFSPGWQASAEAPALGFGAKLPEGYSGPLEVGLGHDPRYTVKLSPHGGLSSPIKLDEGRAIYRNAYPATDAIYVASAHEVELFFVLRHAGASTEYTWDVRLPAGLPKVQNDASGGLLFVDETGQPRVHIPQPFAVDARGTRRNAELAWRAGRLALRLDTHGLAFPILLDPVMAEFGWTQVATTGPSARRYVHIAYDRGRKRTVLFGGYNGAALGDTWEWDGTSWAQKCTTFPCNFSVPQARWGNAIAYDAARGKVIMFGGKTTGALGDTWQWDGTSWTQLSSTGPNARYYLPMVYDSARQKIVLFSGRAASNDTWEWDGSAWTQVCTNAPCNTNLPPARYWQAMAYDSVRQRTVIFAGLNALQQPINDVWEWDGTSWTQKCTSAPCTSTLPAPRSSAEMTYHSARGKVVLYGGDLSPGSTTQTWEWDGTSFAVFSTSPAPTIRADYAMDYDSFRARAVLFGGWGSSNYKSDTWEYYTTRIPCTSGAECETGSCTDGVCCQQSVCGTCQACNTASSPGTCAAVLGGNDPDTCSGASTCGPTGACGFTNGHGCSVGTECASGNCADGLCCNTACNGSCDVCAASLGASADGTCTTAPAGYAGNPSCGPYACTGTSASCNGISCASDATCGPGFYCAGNGTCAMQKTQGASCNLTAGADCFVQNCRACTSGSCVDGFCCDTGCSGACDRCDATPGTCTNAVPGSAGSPSCSPYACDGGTASCPAACATDNACGSGFFCDAPTCTMALYAGSSCDRDRQCDSGFCVDGFCCNTACAGPCDACNRVAFEGTCMLADPGAPGNPACAPFACDGLQASCSGCSLDSQCAPGNYCNGSTCMPQKSSGQACTGAKECLGASCVDGRCCDTACAGACDVCAAALGASADGVCTVAPAGYPGSPACGAYTCSGTSATCNGSSCGSDLACGSGFYCGAGGTCQPQKNQGTSCSLAPGLDCKVAGCRVCATGQCVDGYCCNQACGGPCDGCSASPGSCTFAAAQSSGSPSCTPYLCTGASASCGTGCATDLDCANGSYCAADGTCRSQKPTGQSCGNTDCQQSPCRQCSSGYCVDGTCCQSACTGACDVCSSSGVCTLVSHGAVGNPTCAPYVCSGSSGSCTSSCAVEADCAAGYKCQASSCVPKTPLGQGCANAAECASGFCADGICCSAACDRSCDLCNGAIAGQCQPAAAGYAGTPSCGRYVCNGLDTSCPNVCTTSAECAPGLDCIMGSCTGQLADGSSCSSMTVCASGNCVDGVCCNVACSGSCFSCALPGKVGTCTPAANGTDPRGLCPGTGPCKAVCNSGGLCAYPDSTACGAAQCIGDSTLHRTSTCDGAGACKDRGTQDCAVYLCAGATCPTSCVDDSVCSPGHHCQNGTCGLHVANGTSCMAASDCDSTHCADGVCCQTACNGRCQRCDLPAQPGGAIDGICRVPVGFNLDGDCPGDGVCAGVCQPDATCSFPGAERKCDTCKVCNGQSRCSHLPDDDSVCTLVACDALGSECRTYEPKPGRCVELGLCAHSNDLAVCTQIHDAPDGTACSGGQCRAGSCSKNQPADGSVQPEGGSSSGSNQSSGGCDFVPGGKKIDRTLMWLLLAALIERSRRRARS